MSLLKLIMIAMKNILITGGTGLIGSTLCKLLVNKNHQVIVLSRNPEAVSYKCGTDVKGIQTLAEIDDDLKIDWVINLAGEPIADKPWTNKRKAKLEASRIDLTRDLVNWISQRKQAPECLISGSAVGWYGDGADNIITEQSEFTDEYAHQLCDAWEQQALCAEQLGIRVCIVRTGLVIASKGGFSHKMLLPFKLGVGGKLGSGQQFMPWIHITDMVNLIVFLASNNQAKGAYNGCSPNPARNEVFTKTLAEALHRYAFIPVPARLLKPLLGEMSHLLLTGQRAIPEKAQAMGFRFHYTDLKLALADVLSTNK
jgi:uncharacterized protein (TIGR01777 family)